MALEIILILIFIIINGFFAASEIAIVSMRRSRIKQLIEEGRLNADVLHRLREEPDRFLATIQIGVTIAGALASAIGGAAAAENLKAALKKRAGALYRLCQRAHCNRHSGFSHCLYIPGFRRAGSEISGALKSRINRPVHGAADRKILQDIGPAL